ncbi:hypothetical protein [Bacteroides heparinolyticus]|uniref:hypothetical protein n=1 Tax=Prevotella heparinolytica TaxID=28113 RepID=UPI0023F05167|nr:hypothetical protein [Bacteroides heparinolyticus]
MIKQGSFITNIVQSLKYRKVLYPVFYCLLFTFVIFENFSLGPALSLSDIIYGFFLVYFVFKTIGSSRTKSKKLYWIPIIFLGIAVINYLSFNATKMFFSQLRFVFNCTFFTAAASYILRKSSVEKEKVLDTYIYICTLASFFIIIQFLSFYILHFNLKFDFGNYQGSVNTASLAIPGVSPYRTGGIFKEPSWYAVFMSPVLDIAYRRNKITELIICILGLIFSTSSMGFLFLFVFVSLNFKNNIKYLVWFGVILFITYYIFPVAFERLFEALDFSGESENSNDIRVIAPFGYIFSSQTLPILGMNIEDLYVMYDDNFFLNTFLFVLMSFGLLGMVVFLNMIWNKSSLSISIIILITVIIEGCYGRIDFWLPLLAATVFNDSCKFKKYESNNNRCQRLHWKAS